MILIWEGLRYIFNKYPFIEQFDSSDCGVTCIATICKFYGLKVTNARLREMSGTDKNGNNALSLVYTLKKLGFDSEGIQISKDDLFAFDALPAIFHVINKKEGMLHYILVYKANKDVIVYADPASGIVRAKPEEFWDIWSGIIITAIPNENFQKGNMSPNFLLEFLSLLKTQKKLLLKIFLASLVYTGLSILGAYFYKLLVDIVLPKKALESLTYLSIGFIALSIFKLLLNIYRTRLLLFFGRNIDMELIVKYYRHVLYLPMNFFETRKSGEVISRFSDAFLVRDAISSVTLSLMIDVLMAFFGAIILIRQSFTLFSIVLVTVILYSFIVYGFIGPFKRLNKKEMEESSKITSVLVESINGIETIKSSNMQEKFEDETTGKLKGLMDLIIKISYFGITQDSLISLVKVIGTIGILWCGAYYIIKGQMTIGELFTFNALTVYFLDPVSNLINLQSNIQTALVAAERLGEIMELNIEKESPDINASENEPTSGKIKDNICLNGDIEVKDLYFRYGMRKNTLENINLRIKKGEKVAIIGESGSGKTTLAKLILAFYFPLSGNIKINGIDLKDIPYTVIRDRIAYVSQNIFLFSKTIKENVTKGQNYTEEEFLNVLKLAQCYDFIENLPLKSETVLAENGASLSGGQRQRIAIARALISKPDIIVMDEATSNLDQKTEMAIVDALLKSDKTIIVIAHRSGTIAKCERSIRIEDGKIVD